VTRRVMIVEPDASTRALVDRVLHTAGYAAEDFVAARDARVLLDEGAFDVAVVNEVDDGGDFLDGVRFLRARYPALPLVVTGAMLSAPALLELLRLGARDALPKPFSPNDLRDAVARALRGVAGNDDALDYAAALAAAADALTRGRTDDAARALARARARSPLDGAVTALDALRAEMEGRDDDAARGYRAAMALDTGDDAPNPAEGLARLAAYAGAAPVDALPPRFADATVTLVDDPRETLAPGGDSPTLTVFGVRLGESSAPAVRLRARGDAAFALLLTDLSEDRAAPLVARTKEAAR